MLLTVTHISISEMLKCEKMLTLKENTHDFLKKFFCFGGKFPVTTKEILLSKNSSDVLDVYCNSSKPNSYLWVADELSVQIFVK